MLKFKLIFTVLLAVMLGSCTGWAEKKTDQLPPQSLYVNEEDQINLQHPYTRVIVKCFATAREPAESCAGFFEAKGYVRFRDIPYKTANYDFLKGGSYPTRRWRSGELTPRW